MSNRRKRKGILKKRRFFDEAGVGSLVDLPSDEKELLKTVPAKVEGVVVGQAHLYDDGSVDVVIDPDAPEEAVAKMKEVQKEFMYTMGIKEN